MDFVKIVEKVSHKGEIVIQPQFMVTYSKDLMIRSGKFYGIWDPTQEMWATDIYVVRRLVDDALYTYVSEHYPDNQRNVVLKTMKDFSTGLWEEFMKYVKSLPDSYNALDNDVTFASDKVEKKDYRSKRLPYDICEGDTSAFDELIGTLYAKEDVEKILWCIGSILCGDGKKLQKFLVLYGSGGTGKSTVISIIEKIFAGYYSTFDAKAVTNSSNQFALETFKTNPLVAIQHDGDLSKIEDNSKLNSITAHELMTINEKNKPLYSARINSFLFMGTNKPVKITDSKSGIIRRLIDVVPTGVLVSPQRYEILWNQIEFELGAIAHKAVRVYKDCGKNYYNGYKPINMMMQTDVFYNFVESYYNLFDKEEYINLSTAYDLYKGYCEESGIKYISAKHAFREEFKDYFEEFHPVLRIEGKQIRSCYRGFLTSKFSIPTYGSKSDKKADELTMDLIEQRSELDICCADNIAQLATDSGIPKSKWDKVKTTLKEVDTRKLHYLALEPNHIVIDFDIKNDAGEKDISLNIAEASKWPPTYTEVSKGGNGLHLHYFYDGDTDILASDYGKNIEIKKGTIRRKLSLCNKLGIATLTSGLPTKEKKVLDHDVIITENTIRQAILKNLRKEVHSATKPSIDFINHILDEAYESGIRYNVEDMKPDILKFAETSTNQSRACIAIALKMKYKSDHDERDDVKLEKDDMTTEERLKDLYHLDIEVYKNIWFVVMKQHGAPREDCKVYINPNTNVAAAILKHKFTGYNVRGYDNHILYGGMLGLDIKDVFELSQRIIKGKNGEGKYMEAYNASYVDTFEMLSNPDISAKSLKFCEVYYGIKHNEWEFNFDEDLPEDKVEAAIEYCKDDVMANEYVFTKNITDFEVKVVLSKLSGLAINASTTKHMERLMFGKDKNPEKNLKYTNLADIFPTYTFEFGKTTYLGEPVSEGGEVRTNPGVYSNVLVLDVKSMHPHSGIELGYFGKYQQRYQEILKARILIKEGKPEEAGKLLGGILKPFITTKEDCKIMAQALKLIINKIYGLTCARFDTPFKHPLNKDNIIAKRGALFMINLWHECVKRGVTPIHIKTDSIKLENPPQELVDFVIDYGKQYGYFFDVEEEFSKFALTNKASYIGKDKNTGEWHGKTATFTHPYLLNWFNDKPSDISDLGEIKNVMKGKMYLLREKEGAEPEFVGKVGKFIAMKPSHGKLLLKKPENKEKFEAVQGTKGTYWLEYHMVIDIPKLQDYIDYDYYNGIVEQALEDISKVGNLECDIRDWVKG